MIANNGKEAVRLFKEQPFDLILMDIQMQEMGGLEATAKIREIEKESGGKIPIIALTADAMEGDRESFLNAGMDDYVSKPMKINDITKIIKRVTE